MDGKSWEGGWKNWIFIIKQFFARLLNSNNSEENKAEKSGIQLWNDLKLNYLIDNICTLIYAIASGIACWPERRSQKGLMRIYFHFLWDRETINSITAELMPFLLLFSIPSSKKNSNFTK